MAVSTVVAKSGANSTSYVLPNEFGTLHLAPKQAAEFIPQ
jgi:hypothetical protein